MFNKIMLATAITAASGGAYAASWDSALTTAVTHHAEGIAANAVAGGFDVSNAVITIGTELAVNDTVTFTYSVDKATNSNWPTSIYSNNVGAAAATLEIDGIDSATATAIQLKLVSNSSTDSQTGVVIGDKFTVASNPGKTFTVKTLTAGSGVPGNADGEIVITPALAVDTVDEELVTFLNQTVELLTFGLQSSTANSATYRVLSKAGGSTSVGASVPAPAVAMNVAAATAAGLVTVTYSAASSAGAALDAYTTAATVATVAKKQTLSISKKLDGIVDVEADKKSLTGLQNTVAGADDTGVNVAGNSNDSIIIDYATVTGVAGVTLATAADGTVSQGAVSTVTGTLGTSVTVIDGDFTWMDAAAAAGITLAAAAVTGDQTDVVSLATTGAQLTVTQSSLTADQVILLQATEAANVLPVTSWSGVTTVSYTPAASGAAVATEVYTWADLGAWTLNGATVTAYGVPMGSSVSRFLWVNNNGSADAALTYTVTMNGSTYGPYSIGTVAGKSSSSVAGLIDIDLAARSIYVAPSSRANITLTSQVKAADITVSAAYKHIGDADRLTIETSDSIDGTAK